MGEMRYLASSGVVRGSDLSESEGKDVVKEVSERREFRKS